MRAPWRQNGYRPVNVIKTITAGIAGKRQTLRPQRCVPCQRQLRACRRSRERSWRGRGVWEPPLAANAGSLFEARASILTRLSVSACTAHCVKKVRTHHAAREMKEAPAALRQYCVGRNDLGANSDSAHPAVRDKL